MRIGTRSVLFGGHCPLIHPWFVAAAWWRLYGFPADPRLWVAFFVHDLGYLGKPNMDGPEGEAHVVMGGRMMGWLFGPEWEDFTRCHSRFWSRRLHRAEPSRLCYADKLATALTPWWLYLPLTRLSGELAEFRAEEYRPPSRGWRNPGAVGDREWLVAVQDYAREYVAAHVRGGPDTWTPSEEATA